MDRSRVAAAALLLLGCKIEAHPGWQGAGSDSSGPSSASASDSTSDTSGTTGSGTSSSDGTTSTTGGSGATGSTGSTGSTGAGPTGGTGPAPDEHLIFASSSLLTGAMGGIAGADAECQALADAAGLLGSYLAVLSSSGESAAARLTIGGAVRNRIGELVATDATELWSGTLQTGVSYDEIGMSASGVTWTGSNADGTTKTTCMDWTSEANEDFGTQGNPDTNGPTWLGGGDDRCFKVKRLYCISQ